MKHVVIGQRVIVNLSDHRGHVAAYEGRVTAVSGDTAMVEFGQNVPVVNREWSTWGWFPIERLRPAPAVVPV